MKAQVIRDENGQAVRIPEGLQLPADEGEVEIEAQPWGFVIRRQPRKLTGLAAKFAAFGPEFLPEGRPDPGDEEERDWGKP